MNNEMSKNAGFTLIELMIVVTILSILAAVSIPGFIGLQERGRKGAVIRSGEAGLTELQSWMTAAKKTGLSGNLTEVDTNVDGMVSPGGGPANDWSNNGLASNGIVTVFVASMQSPMMSQRSPWNPANPLWRVGPIGPAVDQAACNADAAANPGQITLCATPSEDGATRSIFMTATSLGAEIIHQKSVTAD
jgi:prepilin-type N-terminal cleavage/methylation domain-containing protein